MTSLFDRHHERLERAVDACRDRGAWTPFTESPSRRYHPEGAKDAGYKVFSECLGSPFPLAMPGETGRVGKEVSPYTGEALGVDYPAVDVDALYAAMKAAMPSWTRAGVDARIGACMEILHRLSEQVFANAYATMHTSGQSFMMAFAGSGANSLDRGLEAVAYAFKAMRDVPTEASFERRFGAEPVQLHKEYRLVPRGIAVVVACGSYPAWNAYPALLANLATGNPVVIKPHPNGILPMAMAVKTAREVLEEAGYDPNLVTLAADEPDQPITKTLVQHPSTAIIDFTGSQTFGAWLESNCRHAQVYTETSGCNAVVVESTDDLEGLLAAVGQSIALFSAQMCTAVQNIFIPRDGIRVRGERLPAEAFCTQLVQTVETMLSDPAHAAAICGAVHSEATLKNITRASEAGNVLRASTPYAHPEFPNARTATPLILESQPDSQLHRHEHFGPIAFVIKADDAQHALQLAARDAKECGAIASYAYSTDRTFQERVKDAFADAGASVGINLIGHRPINFTAAFSDYHVTGLNPAGNACLTDLAFVANRFRIVQSKTELPREF